jgi:uncharacterized repeat protein (TIGR03803 family)
MRLSVFSRYALGICVAIATLSGCGGQSGALGTVPQGGGNIPDAFAPASAKITITPSEISLNSGNGGYSQDFGGMEIVEVAESGYTGSFRSNPSACQGVASFEPHTGKGPKLSVVVYGNVPGSCTIIFSDAKKHTARLSITVLRSLYKVVHYFKGRSDGANPNTVELIKLNGVFYGTSVAGGHAGGGACPVDGYIDTGCGTVYSVNPSSGIEHIVYAFKGSSDGQRPAGGLIAVNGLLYGTTAAGGHVGGCKSGLGKGCGTVFEVNPSTGKHRVIYAFSGSNADGEGPGGGVIAVNGTLYGATGFGGANSYGTIFKMTPSASGYTESVLYSFKGPPDGAIPGPRLLMLNGKLYSTTAQGGSGKCSNSPFNGCGTVFEVNIHTGAERVVYSFKGGSMDGLNPDAALIDMNGELYSTTFFGGSGKCSYGAIGCGTVFKVKPTTGTEGVLYSFKGYPHDGGWVNGGLIALNGALYGTTQNGGLNFSGIVYKLTPLGAGYSESVLHSFEGGASDGEHPLSSLFFWSGKLYGTTVLGGHQICAGGDGGCGTVFEDTP